MKPKRAPRLLRAVIIAAVVILAVNVILTVSERWDTRMIWLHPERQ
jgi:hypothetical protein